MKLYLSGPMSGLPDFNFPAFNEAAHNWSALGFDVFNPADQGWGDGDPVTGTVTEKEWRDFLREDIRQVASSDVVAVLPGWELSRGATFEVAVAVKLGIGILDAITGHRLDPQPRCIIHLDLEEALVA